MAAFLPFRNVAPTLARLAHPLAVKASLSLVEPVQWKGGALAFFPKPGSSDPTSCDEHREIVLSDISAKAVQNIRRRKMVALLERCARPLMCGGLNRKGCDIACMAVRAHNIACCEAERCSVVVFVDVVAAFYNVPRRLFQLITQPDGSATSLATEIGASPHLAAELSASLRDTWYTLPADDAITAFDSGLLPGNPGSDVCFNMAMKKALDRAHELLRNVPDADNAILAPPAALQPL